MFSIQLGSALSLGMIPTLGPLGTAWLRLSMGALILLALACPPLKNLRLRDSPVVVGLGVATALMSVTFLAAMERIPMGTAVAIEFLGPLTVAALRGRGARSLILPATALAGVVLLTEPWAGSVDLLGVGFAVMGAVGWAIYILLTQRVGDRFSGIGALALTIPIAAVAAAPFGLPQAMGHITRETVAVAAALAALIPVLPYILEMLALRRMTHSIRDPPGTGTGHRLAARRDRPASVAIDAATRRPLGRHCRRCRRPARRTPPTATRHTGFSSKEGPHCGRLSMVGSFFGRFVILGGRFASRELTLLEPRLKGQHHRPTKEIT
ncbi:threonine/homoserine efflux transporter RhtA [Arthrobacter sp. 2762]